MLAVCGVAVAGTAAAQPQQADAPAAAQDAAPLAPAVPDKDIIVTGSRTVKNGDASPTPVTVVTTENLTNLRPTSITESINTLPVFSGSRGAFSNPGASGGVSGGNGNAAQLNLRNLGGQRTLVLLDGRRVPPTSFTNIVDADVIPQLLVKRVDTVTGGVSAVYGSDAVSGVVNFITDTKFEGLKMQAQAGISQLGDDPSQEAAIAFGKKFADGKGHFEASYEFRNDSGIDSRASRSWLNRPVVTGAGTAASPYTLTTNTTISTSPFGGRINGCGTGCALAGQYFGANGVLSAFNNGTASNSAGVQSGGAGGYYDNSLKAATRQHQIYARFDYDLTDDIHAFFVGSGNFKHNTSFGSAYQLGTGETYSTGNAFLSPAYASQMTGSTFTMSSILAEAGRPRYDSDTRQLMFTAGLEGKIGSKYDWSLSYVRGDSRLTTVISNDLNQQKLSAALDAVNVNGVATCYAATQANTAAAYANCSPLNLFGPSAASAASLAYIMDTTRYVASTGQHDVNASISGSPFSTWAGEVTTALSGEWRMQSFSATSTSTPTMYANCTNLRYNCSSSTTLDNITLPSNPHVSQSVWEVAGEANVPLVKDARFFRDLSVNLAARYTKYNTVGAYWTWKIGGDWKVSHELRFRGTISRDIRAPTLNDLYATQSVVPVSNQDLLGKTPTGTLVPSVNLSNPNLTAEIGKTWTAGFVYKPDFIRGFSLAVDYYNIKISNAITTVQGFQPSTQQGCNTGGISLYCNLIQRDPTTGAVTAWYVQPINLSKITTYGVDFEANYATHIGNHAFNLRGLTAWQPHIRYIQPGVAVIDQGDVAFGSNGLTASPSWRITGTASFNVTQAFRLDAIYRWRNSMKLWGDPTVVWAPGQGTVGAFGQLGLNASFSFDAMSAGKGEFFVNVQNLFDAKPQAINAPGTSTGPGGFGGWAMTDDPVGRYFTAGVRLKF
ncbi:TonB-dependent receptor domain-containing protein [Novosphingobium terrae]|uniref:TonB-dependent receptor domain-containing protein n=1 Tax=Novosphingobium terrae TaxID=2726189 RepID=UPI00197CF6F8|nr:TonB-dependent receptor [Novosphingobium terrae]